MTEEPRDVATADDFGPAGIGHNTGLLTGDALTLNLEVSYAELLERGAELLEKAAPFLTVESDEQDSESTEFLVKVRAAWKAAEAARVAEKHPYDDAAGRVHAFFKTNVLDPLEKLGARVNAAQTAFKVAKVEAERRRRQAEAAAAAEVERQAQAERQRLQREADDAARVAARKRNAEAIAAAEAQAREAQERARVATEEANRAAEQRAEAAKAAEAPAADLSRARGGRGGVSSLRGRITFRDLDRDALDLEALRGHLSDDALGKAVNSWIKANRGAAEGALRAGGKQPLKGVTIFEDMKNAGRA